MNSMNISLPDTVKAIVYKQVVERGDGSRSEYPRGLFRDWDRQHLRGLLLAGAESPLLREATPEFFSGLRQRVRQAVNIAPRKTEARRKKGP